MQNDIVIKIDNLSKFYKLYDQQIDRVKEVFNPFGKKYHREFHALHNVTFEVKRGETVGIIGNNGSGKSTLLKIITGIITPSSGTLKINGKISALLELGAGFNPEFTGIENIYMNGMIMGYTHSEMDSKLNEILSFADIGEFVHQPVKTYSSGMFVRLAFAVNACVNPEILIVDEALSVGDIFFQNKCFKKFEDIRANNTSILFVSHDLMSVRRFCDRVLWLQDGKMVMFGEKNEVCSAYLNNRFDVLNKQQSNYINNLQLESVEKKIAFKEIKHFPAIKLNNSVKNKLSKDVEIISFFICDTKNEVTNKLKVGFNYTAHIVGKFYSNVDNAIFGFVLENAKGINILALNSYLSTQKVISAKTNEYVEVIFSFCLPKIMNDQYLISPAIASGNQESHIILTWLHNLLKVEIVNPGFNLSILELDSSLEVKVYNENQVKV